MLDQCVQYRSPGLFPRGTWLINLTGSFVRGIVLGLGARHGLPEQAVPIAGVGFCDAYTTFSTFSDELVHLREKGQVRKSLRYGASSPAVGLLVATAGLAIGSF